MFLAMSAGHDEIVTTTASQVDAEVNRRVQMTLEANREVIEQHIDAEVLRRSQMVPAGSNEEAVMDEGWQVTGEAGAGAPSSALSPNRSSSTGATPKRSTIPVSKAGAAAPSADVPPVAPAVYEINKDPIPMRRADPNTEAFTPVFTTSDQPAEIILPSNVNDVPHWGQAVLTTGKNKDRRYREVAETDPVYNKWVLARTKLSPALLDYRSYLVAAGYDKKTGQKVM